MYTERHIAEISRCICCHRAYNFYLAIDENRKRVIQLKKSLQNLFPNALLKVVYQNTLM